MVRGMLKILSMLSGEFDSKVMADGFKAVLIKQMAEPFPSKQLANLLREMPSQKKKNFSSFMNLQIRPHPNKPFPDDKFLQLVRLKVKNQPEKAKFIQGMVRTVIDVYGDIEELSADDFLSREEEITMEFGPWHYYWGLRLFPAESAEVEKRLVELEELLPDATSQIAETNDANVIPINPNQNAKEAKSNSLVSKERELRQKAEQTIAGLESKVRTLEKSNDRLNKEREGLLAEKNTRDIQLKQTTEALGIERKKTQTLEHEKGELRSLNNKLEKSVEQLTANEQGLRKQFEEDLATLREELTTEPQASEMAEKLIASLNNEADNYYAQLRSGQVSRQEQAIIRRKINDCFGLIESLEGHFSFAALPPIESVQAEPAPVTIQTESMNSEGEFVELLEDHLPAENKEVSKKYQGTFYRKDHGGYVVLENNEIFNLPESMVNAIGLEHEAGVECEPSRRADGSTQHTVKLLFQGDDAYAPMTQFMGYVELGEHFIYYCVDMNNPDNRFPIYEKDVEIQQPKNGDPCLFNVAIDGEYARLSKVYKGSAHENTQKDLIAAKEKSLIASTKRKNERTKQEVYLEGCTIVIVGGLEKWFESVVKETGAELYHENGSNPERIHAKLRRADALFLLHTATSHEATWSCVDIAKENNVPLYKIEGSKSNLRKLLWDNREKIRKEGSTSASA
jgi:hypothetical protein